MYKISLNSIFCFCASDLLKFDALHLSGADEAGDVETVGQKIRRQMWNKLV
jgi:hypothetical protein